MIALIEQLLAENKHNWSPATIDRYSRRLRQFASFIASRKMDYRDVSVAIVSEWLGCHEWGQSSKHNALCALRAFYRYAVGKARSPVESMRIHRPKGQVGRTLSFRELELLLGSLDTSSPKGIRDLSIIMMLYDTGMRASELCGLQLCRLDLPAHTLQAFVKGQRWQPKAYGAYAASCLDRWLAIRDRHASAGIESVYVGIGGAKPGTRMTPSGLRAVFRDLARAANLPHFSPHAFRRTFATHSLLRGDDMRTVQIRGGWATLEMLLLYSRAISVGDLSKPFPSDRLMGISDSGFTR